MDSSPMTTSSSDKLKVLIVGQTPPPVGGQSIMIDKLLRGRYEHVEIFHVRMSFARDMADAAQFRAGKLLTLLRVIAKIIYLRIRHGIAVLYYPPASPDRVPMYRDIAVLLSVRWMFSKTIFHFHAGGISELYPTCALPLRLLFRRAYYGADAAVQLSELNPPDGKNLRSKEIVVIPYGIEDRWEEGRSVEAGKGGPRQILFVGVLRESKGVGVLIDAARILREHGVEFCLRLMGEFQEEDYRRSLLGAVSKNGLEEHVTFLGVLTGEAKWRAYREASIFCFPTYFEGETFGIVILEAMQSALPVVVSDWRGIPSLVRDGETGYVVPARESAALAEKFELLLKSPELIKTMGKKGRARYLEKYRLDTFQERMEQLFLRVAGDKGVR